MLPLRKYFLIQSKTISPGSCAADCGVALACPDDVDFDQAKQGETQAEAIRGAMDTFSNVVAARPLKELPHARHCRKSSQFVGIILKTQAISSDRQLISSIHCEDVEYHTIVRRLPVSMRVEDSLFFAPPEWPWLAIVRS